MVFNEGYTVAFFVVQVDLVLYFPIFHEEVGLDGFVEREGDVEREVEILLRLGELFELDGGDPGGASLFGSEDDALGTDEVDYMVTTGLEDFSELDLVLLGRDEAGFEEAERELVRFAGEVGERDLDKALFCSFFHLE